MADTSTAPAYIKSPRTIQTDNYSPYQFVEREVDFAMTEVDIGQAGTHDLYEFAQYDGFIDATFLVTTAFAGGTSIRFIADNGSTSNISGVIPVANLVVGKVFHLGLQDVTATAGQNFYMNSATATDRRLQVLNVGTFTAGIGLLTIKYRPHPTGQTA